MRIRESVSAGGILILLAAACVETIGRPALYEKELLDCTADSGTARESIECENKVRARYGRPLRDAGVD